MDAHGYVTAEEVRTALREVYRDDRETNLQKALLHVLRDRLKPLTPAGKWKANPIVILLGFLALAALAVFVFFSYRGAL